MNCLMFLSPLAVGSAYIDRGLDEAAATLYSPADDIQGYHKVLFVLTDGRQREPVNLKEHTK